jgi:hypothetical protein
MAESVEARNKALVLKAFDTLFNKRDYAAVERLWSPNYIQHSAHIEPGREGHKYSQILRMPGISLAGDLPSLICHLRPRGCAVCPFQARLQRAEATLQGPQGKRTMSELELKIANPGR